MQFNQNECIVRGPNGEMIAMGLRNDDLYEIIFIKVRGVDMGNLEQSWKKDGHLRLSIVRLGI